MWIVKLSANAGIVSTQNISVQKNLQVTLSPNPANDYIRLNIISDKLSVLLQADYQQQRQDCTSANHFSQQKHKCIY